MNIIETTFEKLPTKCLLIGFEGENLRATVRIDCSSVFAEYPNATPTLIVKPLFADAYPVVVDRNGTNVDWLITSEILSFSGDGEIQLVFYKDQVICKSAITKIRVCRSLTVTGEMPDPVVQWIENANRKLAEVDAQIVELEGMVDTATDAATRAEQSASTASTKAEQAAGSAATATAKANEATNAAGTATAKAAEAEQSALTATEKATAAAESERIATAKAVDATTAATTATAKAEQATEAAQTATEKAGDASASARAAHASEINAAESADDALSAEVGANAAKRAAETSATQASISEQNAGTAAQTATQKAAEATQNATNAATFAGTATTKAEEAAASAQAAQDAKTAVEQTAEQLADSLEQIDQNTADIAEHEQEYNALKEATLIHNTASGSIASFVDGAEMPVDEVTCEINPVQDLHGYDNPWPAGGGKNLLGFKIPNGRITASGVTITQNNDGSITLNGTSNAQFAWNQLRGAETFAPQKLTAGTKYTLSGSANKPQNQTYIQLIYKDDVTGEIVSFVSQNATPTSITPTNNCTYRSAYCTITSGTSFSNETLHPQFEVGNATDYAPYSNICPISGFDSLKVSRTGKNLLNESVKTQTATYVFFNSTGDTSEKTMTLPAGTYTISVSYTGTFKAHINVYRMNPYERIAVAYFATSLTFTLTKAEDILLWMQNSDFSIQDIGTIQIELGSTATAYEPYQGETYDIAFPSEAGTVYGGSLTIAEDGSGVLTVDRAMVDLGTLNWEYVQNVGKTKYYFISSNEIANAKPSIGGVPNCISNRYKTASWGATVDNAITNNCITIGWVGKSYTAICDSAYSDAVAFKTAMSGVQLVYELATPITYTLTASQIRTLLGENNLWHDANGDISVGYKANTKLYIDGKIAELVAQIVNS